MEQKTVSRYILSQAPHVRAPQSMETVMWLVVIALLPAAFNAIVFFGIHSLLVMLVAIGAAVLAEFVTRLLLKKPVSVKNGSAVLTGLLLAMNLPPQIDLWIAALGSVFAIVIVKELFGGLGYNIFNPALAGRAFLMASYPADMTTLWHPFSATNKLSALAYNMSGMPAQAYDTVTGATPLGALKEMPGVLAGMNVPADKLYDVLFSTGMLKSMALGNIGGCIGETSAIFLLLGAAFLFYKKIITWHTPFSYILGFSTVIFCYYFFNDFSRPGLALLYHLLAGGLILGAFFMATDMVTSPMTAKGMIIFGLGGGTLAAIIRLWGGYPEGVSYSILLMNACVPLIDRWTKPKIYGAVAKKD